MFRDRTGAYTHIDAICGTGYALKKIPSVKPRHDIDFFQRLEKLPHEDFDFVVCFGGTNDFNDFKKDLLGEIRVMNMNTGQIRYSGDDLKSYLSNMSKLGIYDTKLAEAQLKAVIEGNKIAGLSYETQAGLLKIGRRSNNDRINENWWKRNVYCSIRSCRE